MQIQLNAPKFSAFSTASLLCMENGPKSLHNDIMQNTTTCQDSMKK